MSRARDLAVTPSSARRRAAAVNRVTRDPAVPRRPLLWCLFAGSAAVGTFVLILFVLVRELPAGGDPVPALLLLAPACAASTWAFCYGWELYDAGKATRLWLLLVFGGVAVVIVAALVLLVLAATKSDLDLDLDLGDMAGAVGETIGEAGVAIADTVGEVGLDALEAWRARTVPMPEAVLSEAEQAAALAAIGGPAAVRGSADPEELPDPGLDQPPSGRPRLP